MLLRGDVCLRSYPAGWLIMAVLLMAGALLAQTPTARITGTITDSSGAIVPGAKISVLGQATGLHADATSNQNGIYNLPFLNPGRYELTVEATGFRRYVRPTLVLETGQILSLDIRLEVGPVANAVTVTAQTPLLQADASSVNQLIENATVANMPLASRKAASLVRLMGNVVFLSEEGNDVVNFSLGGGRGRQGIWLFDGGAIQHVALLAENASFNPPVEAIQELKVESNSYPAEFGRSTGGFVSMTTKSGTNQFHGSLYDYFRNDVMDARRFFSPGVSPRKSSLFGGTIGGPIRKDKTHFFFSYEGTRRGTGFTRVYNVPTPAEVRGDFSASSAKVTDPLTRQPFASNVIPEARLDPVGAKIAALYPAPNVPGAASGSNNFRRNVVENDVKDTYTTRIDHSFSATDRLTVRHLYWANERSVGGAMPVRAADPNATDPSSRIHHVTATWFHSFGPATINELRFTDFWRNGLGQAAGTFVTTLARDLGLKGVAEDGMPRVNVTGLTSLGSSSQYTSTTYNSVHIVESLSRFRGKHALKFGGEWRAGPITNVSGSTRSGSLSFNDVATGRGFALAALLLGWTNSASVDSGEVEARTDYYGLYVQDDWKISPRLTLNMGLRWEMETPRSEAQNRQSGFDRYAINPVSGTPGIVTFAGVGGVSRYAHDFDKNNFGPRFGFAWRPWGERLVLRGGYGLSYGPIYDGTGSANHVVGFGDVRQFLSRDNGLTPAFLLRNGMPAAPQEERGPGFGAVRVGESVRISPDFLAKDHRNSYAHQFTLGIQRQLLGTYLLDLTYTGNLAHRVTGRTVNINEIRPELRGATQDQRLRPFPQYGSVSWIAPDWGNASYHALNAKVEKRFSGGLNLLANYTWSKTIDDVEARIEAGGAPGDGQQSYYSRRLDKSLSGNDMRHRLVASFVYELPVGKGRRLHPRNRLADTVIGGWSLGTIAEFHTGFPFGVVESSNRLNAFSSSQRPNIVGNAGLPTDRPRAQLVDRWFNIDAFAFPGNGVLGKAARNVGTGPGFANFDVSLLKDFRFSERRFVQLRGEFLNLFNRANFGLPNGSRGSAAFGKISDTVNDGRIAQLGLRFVF